MKIIFAQHIGFCSGVRKAIAIAENSLKQDPAPIQFLGALIHNEKVLELFKRKGIKFVADLRRVRSGTLIIQAHGFPPFSKKFRLKLKIRDATCPLVRRIQRRALNLRQQGFQVIIIGDKDHDEVKGINGWINNEAVIVEDETGARKMTQLKKIGAVVQSTQNPEKVRRIIKILRTKAAEFKWFNTICPEVITRQKETDEIIAKCDGVLVIGSRSSANTARLAEKVKQSKKKLFWINSLQELKRRRLRGISTLGVVSGTSAPDWEIEKIKKYLQEFKPKT